MTTAYPLHWPQGFSRTAAPRKSLFKTSAGGAIANVQDELRRFGADSKSLVSNLVISSNVTLTAMHPDDGGIAVYFRWENMDCCIAVDRYNWPEENLQAVSLIIDAERTKLRHGGLNIVRASFRGFTALPPPTGKNPALTEPWWKVLGFTSAVVTLDATEAAYRNLVKKFHPDHGGTDPAKFNQIVDAIRAAREALK